MKRIVDFCNKNPDGTSIKESVKLRLRGKGSGYKEGPMNRGKIYIN
jgi:hypothetical protein